MAVTVLVPAYYHVFKLPVVLVWISFRKIDQGVEGGGRFFGGRLVYWRRYGVVLSAEARTRDFMRAVRGKPEEESFSLSFPYRSLSVHKFSRRKFGRGKES